MESCAVSICRTHRPRESCKRDARQSAGCRGRCTSGQPKFCAVRCGRTKRNNRRQLWVPRGFAHGFVVLSETADFFYKCDNPYSPADEIVVRWDDPAIDIQWGVENPSLSARDAAAPNLADVKNLPIYGADMTGIINRDRHSGDPRGA